jgi:hypothetical protein
MVNVSRPLIALCPNERASNASPWRNCFVQAKDDDMRDFRDAKAMAHALRAALAAKGHKITNSESLELIATAFGVADWNSLSAAIRTAAPASSKDAASASPTAKSASTPEHSAELKATLRRALAFAEQRKHQYATLEHLLIALMGDVNASAVMRACRADLGALEKDLTAYVDHELEGLVIRDCEQFKPTAAFQRVVQRAAIHVQSSGREQVTGADVVVAIFAERESRAAYFLQEQDMKRYDAVNYINHGIAKSGGDAPS